MVEAVLDHLASALSTPIDTLRASNWYKEGDVLPFGTILQPGEWRVPLAFSQLEAQADVAARRAAIDEFNQTHAWRKRGLALLPTKFGINFTAKFMNQGGALVHVYTDGTVLISHGGTEMGQGLHTKVGGAALKGKGSFGLGRFSTNFMPHSHPPLARRELPSWPYLPPLPPRCCPNLHRTRMIPQSPHPFRLPRTQTAPCPQTSA